MEWFYAKKGKSAGPLSYKQIKEMVDRDSLTSTDLVWHTGMSEWKQAKDILDFFSPPPLTKDQTDDLPTPPPLPRRVPKLDSDIDRCRADK